MRGGKCQLEVCSWGALSGVWREAEKKSRPKYNTTTNGQQEKKWPKTINNN
jgi:hypothetical protein